VRRKNDDLDKYAAQLKTEEAILKEKIISYENENNGLDADINATVDEIGNLDGQISNAQSELNNLQRDIAEVGALAEKHKSEAIHFHKGTQAEIMRNNDLSKVLGQAENTLRLRVNQVDEGSREVAGLGA
jgi:chromosome segregation ATPase